MDKLNKGILDYINSPSSEDAKRHFVFPLFKNLFKEKFKSETDASRADIYIEGQLVVELKTNFEDWTSGFFQALHYKKKGLSFSSVCVISRNFIGLWKIKKIPEFVLTMSEQADALVAPSTIGEKLTKQINKGQLNEILESASYKLINKVNNQLELFDKKLELQIDDFVEHITQLDKERISINPTNFIKVINLLRPFFIKKIDAVHCFYAAVSYWDETSIVPDPQASRPNIVRVVGKSGRRVSEDIELNPRFFREFKQFIESRYIKTNEALGLTIDYYFSRFDEVLADIDPEYTKQHGIFFTDINLSKFALWFIHYYYETKLAEKYIVFDPAGGSGNLVTSWRRNHLKHKIVSDLEPDLLKTIERRMKQDDLHISSGFTIVPRTTENKGLNFLDISSLAYYAELQKALPENITIDKPFAFLLNPPYKNTDENDDKRIDKDAEYNIHQSIIDITGKDGAKERYLAFLAQIINLASDQVGRNPDFKPILMIFTPTSWLIPRPAYIEFRNKFDKYFKFETGFMVTSYEFFKLKGRFPISFTIWSYNENRLKNKNIVKLKNFTHLTSKDLSINWNIPFEELHSKVKKLLPNTKTILFDGSRGDIRNSLPEILNVSKNTNSKQPRYDYSHAKKDDDFKNKKLVSGFPLNDKERHFGLKRKCGDPLGSFVGFYDDNTPVRINQDNYNRMSNKPDRVWFRLDNAFINLNQTRMLNGAPDKYGFCAYNLESAIITFSWFALTKALNGVYPIWANQFDIWSPKITENLQKKYYSLCFAYGLAENRCIVTKFERDNPISDCPEVYIDNPLCPTNQESFWNLFISKEIDKNTFLAKELINKIILFYEIWNKKYCQGNKIENVGLKDEAYFKYFNYPDFLTPYSGLIQIKKFSEQNSHQDILGLLEDIEETKKKVKSEIYNLLIDDFNYFG